MTLFSLTGIIIILANVFLGFLIFIKASKKIHYIWVVFCLQVAIWGLGVYKIGMPNDFASALFWWKIGYIGVINIPALYAHFIYEYLALKQKMWVYLMYIICLFFQFANLFGHMFIVDLNYLFDSFYYISSPGILYNSFVAIFYLVVLYSFYKLYISIKKKSGHERTQIKAFLITSSIGYLGGVFAFMPVYGIEVYPLLNVLVGIFPLAMIYAILRHSMMDIKLVIQKGVVYSVLLSIITASYLLTIISIEIVVGKNNEVINFFSGLFLIILGIYGVPIIEKYFQKATDKIFYKDKYDLSEALYRLSKTINHNFDIKMLLREVNNELKKTIKVRGVATVLLKDDMIMNFAGKYQRPVYDTPQDFVKVLSEHRIDIMTYQGLEEARQALLDSGDMSRLTVYEFAYKVCQETGTDLIVPIYLEDEILAVTLLKRKKSGDQFDQIDHKLLKTYSYQVGVAIEKARLYTEVKGYSKELESKVEKRTKEIKELEEQQRQLMHEMAHSMQTPLTILKSELSSLASSIKQENKLRSLEKSVDRLSYLIYSMLKLARLESRKSDTKKEIFNLSDLMLELIEEFEIITADKNIKIEMDIEKGVFFGGVPREIEELMNNLVSNSVKYIGRGSDKKIFISLYRKDREIVIKIRDNGMGIKKKDIGHLFERFYRATNDQDEFIKGTGLGLVIAKKIVEKHGGSIEVQSEVGKWSEFLIRFNNLKIN